MEFGNIKLVIFDLDGTLADTMGDLVVSMNKMLSHYGFPHRTRDELLTFINGGAINFVRQALPFDKQADDEFVQAAFEIYNATYAQHYAEVTHLYPGIHDTVMGLKSAGMKLAVLSNKQHFQTNAIIEKLFGANTFDIVIGHADLPHKPDPATVYHIFDTLGVTAEETLFVGDSDVDIRTAINSGTYPIGVAWGYRTPELLIETGAQMIVYNPMEILELI